MHALSPKPCHTTKGWLPKGLQNVLWFVGEEDLDFAQNLLWGHLRGLWQYARLPMGCLEEGTKVGKGKDLGLQGRSRSGQSTPAFKYVNRLLVHSPVCLSPKLGHSNLSYFLV